jgi:sugar diacid utilization regulator
MAVCDKVAAAAVQGADAAELTRVFAQASGKTVVLLDPEFQFQAQARGAAGDISGWGPGDAGTASLLRELAIERRTLRLPRLPGTVPAWDCLATPVMAGDTVLGYLLVAGESADATDDDVDLIVASHAATLFAVALARAQTGRELGQRYQEAVMDSLLSGHFLDTEDARRKARLLGMTDSGPYRVAVARVSESDTLPRPSGDEQAGGLLARLSNCGSFPALVRGSELVMLLPDQELPDITARDHAAGSRLGDLAPVLPVQQLSDARVTCGVSDLMRLPEHAPRALLQAQHAIDLGIRIGRVGQVVCYEELGIYRLLLQIGDMNELVRYAQDVLGPVIDYDSRRKSDLFGTLSVYLNQRESPKQAARVLRVHVNTILYRIQRIESLASLDLTNPDHRLNAHVATKIIESQRSSLKR